MSKSTVLWVDRPQIEVQAVTASRVLYLVVTTEIVTPISRVHSTSDEVHILRARSEPKERGLILSVFCQLDALRVIPVCVVSEQVEVVADSFMPYVVLVVITLSPAAKCVEGLSARCSTQAIDLHFPSPRRVVA